MSQSGRLPTGKWRESKQKAIAKDDEIRKTMQLVLAWDKTFLLSRVKFLASVNVSLCNLLAAGLLSLSVCFSWRLLTTITSLRIRFIGKHWHLDSQFAVCSLCYLFQVVPFWLASLALSCESRCSKAIQRNFSFQKQVACQKLRNKQATTNKTMRFARKLPYKTCDESVIELNWTEQVHPTTHSISMAAKIQCCSCWWRKNGCSFGFCQTGNTRTNERTNERISLNSFRF